MSLRTAWTKLAASQAVDDAMVAADREIHELGGTDLVAFKNGALDNPVGRKDLHFRPVDDRRGGDAAERTERGYGERRAAEFGRGDAAVARSCGEARVISLASCQTFFACASRMTGT